MASLLTSRDFSLFKFLANMVPHDVVELVVAANDAVESIVSDHDAEEHGVASLLTSRDFSLYF